MSEGQKEINKLAGEFAKAAVKLIVAIQDSRQAKEEVEEEVPQKKKVVPKKRAKEEEAPPPPQEEVEEESPAEKSQKTKDPKEKPDGWVCEGNLLDKSPCPLTEDEQQVSSATRHEKKLHNTCKACKLAMRRMLKAQKKNAGKEASE